MKNKKRCSVYRLVAVIFAMLSICLLFMLSGRLTVNAKEEAEPYGIYTKINLDLGGNNGEIYATAKNKFTLGNSTIIVNLYLYSSETYTEDYSLMNFEGYAYSLDLDQGKTLTVSVGTGGRQLYWRALLSYKFDDRDWVEQQTPTILFDKNGRVIQ